MTATKHPDTRLARRRRRRQGGFTVTELVVSLSLLSVVTAIGAPNLSDILENYELRTASYELYAELQWMRSAAITGNTRYRLSLGGSGISAYEKFDVDTGSWATIPRAAPVGLATVYLSGPAELVFRPNGTTVSAASFYVFKDKTSIKTITVSTAGSVRIG